MDEFIRNRTYVQRYSYIDFIEKREVQNPRTKYFRNTLSDIFYFTPLIMILN